VLIIGELINTSRKEIKEAIDKQDAAKIAQIAKDEAAAGADYIDINCGTLVHNEPEIMSWLVNTVKVVVDKPLCIDSPNPLALETGLKLATKGKTMLNSITAEADRCQAILPLVKKYHTKVVALCMDEGGIPTTAEKRISIVEKLVGDLTADGIEEDDIYLDPLVKPISTGDQSGQDILQTLYYLRSNYPNVHATCGLSNISFGLPNRKVLNQVCMIQAMVAGMDSYILNPLDKTMMGLFYASQAVLGKDPFCTGYLKAHRKGLYN
jgi:cobalamin-dependent methionine synthase I